MQRRSHEIAFALRQTACCRGCAPDVYAPRGGEPYRMQVKTCIARAFLQNCAVVFSRSGSAFAMLTVCVRYRTVSIHV
jgi:hypothetical protein